MRKKRLASIAVVVLLLSAIVVPTAAGLPKVPSTPKGAAPVQYPVTIDTVGYINYVWTYDTTEKCSPGYAMTVTEKLQFTSGGPRRAKLAVVYGKAFTTAPRGGSWKLDVKLTDWKETNYCDHAPAKITKPTCRSLDSGRIVYAMGPEAEQEEKGRDVLEPLAQNTNFVVSPTNPAAQHRTCSENRPDVETIGEQEKDWTVDPTGALSVPLATESPFFRNKLGVNETLHRHISIGGRCDGATAKASSLPPNVTSCDIDGHVDVKIKRIG